MTPKPNQAGQERNSNRDFILSKAHSGDAFRKVPAVTAETSRGLAEAYPNMLSGRSLTVRGMSLLEAVPTFGAVVAQIDARPPELVPKAADAAGNAQTAVAAAFEAVCRSNDGLWGLIDESAFGCFWPYCNPPAAAQMAAEIKTKLVAAGGPTVTIGIAFYPTLDYAKEQILDNARKALEHAKFFGPDSLVCFDAVSLNISGDRLYDNGEIQQAIAEYQTALRLDPSNANLHNSLGVCYGVSADYTGALKHFTTAAELDPEEALAHYNAGLVHLMTGERPKALAALLEADRRPHKIFEVALQLGKFFLEDRAPEKSRSYLEDAAARQPESSVAHALMGDCYAALGMADQAVSAYKKSLRLNANEAVSLSGLGWLYTTMDKNADIAKLFCRHSTEIAPQNGLFRHRLGRLYLKENRLKEALREFRQAVDLGHDSAAYLQKVQNRLLDKAS